MPLNKRYLSLWDTAAHWHVLCFWQPWQCLHHCNCLLVILLPSVMDVHMILMRIECEKRDWSTKHSLWKTECHLYLSIKINASRPWLWAAWNEKNNFISLGLQLKKYSSLIAKLSFVAKQCMQLSVSGIKRIYCSQKCLLIFFNDDKHPLIVLSCYNSINSFFVQHLIWNHCAMVHTS